MKGGEEGEESSLIVAPPSWALVKALWRLARSLRSASRKVRKALSYLRSASRKVRLLPASSCTLARETGRPSGPGQLGVNGLTTSERPGHLWWSWRSCR